MAPPVESQGSGTEPDCSLLVLLESTQGLRPVLTLSPSLDSENILPEPRKEVNGTLVPFRKASMPIALPRHRRPAVIARRRSPIDYAVGREFHKTMRMVTRAVAAVARTPQAFRAVQFWMQFLVFANRLCN